jgi:hypothetical protein
MYIAPRNFKLMAYDYVHLLQFNGNSSSHYAKKKEH